MRKAKVLSRRVHSVESTCIQCIVVHTEVHFVHSVNSKWQKKEKRCQSGAAEGMSAEVALMMSTQIANTIQIV